MRHAYLHNDPFEDVEISPAIVVRASVAEGKQRRRELVSDRIPAKSGPSCLQNCGSRSPSTMCATKTKTKNVKKKKKKKKHSRDIRNEFLNDAAGTPTLLVSIWMQRLPDKSGWVLYAYPLSLTSEHERNPTGIKASFKKRQSTYFK